MTQGSSTTIIKPPADAIRKVVGDFNTAGQYLSGTSARLRARALVRGAR